MAKKKQMIELIPLTKAEDDLLFEAIDSLMEVFVEFNQKRNLKIIGSAARKLGRMGITTFD